MEPCPDQGLTGHDRAGDALVERPLRFQRDQGGLGILPVALLQRRLQFAQLARVRLAAHGASLRDAGSPSDASVGPMASGEFKDALQDESEVELTTTGRKSGRE